MRLNPKFRPLLLVGLLAGPLVLAVSLMGRAEPMMATYYADAYAGAPTASGEPYDPYGFTAAHPYLPFGTELLLSHNGLNVVGTVNDRCYCGLDLSRAAAQTIGLMDAGIAAVDVVGPRIGGGPSRTRGGPLVPEEILIPEEALVPGEVPITEEVLVTKDALVPGEILVP
jgi:rare lipoprotein A